MAADASDNVLQIAISQSDLDALRARCLPRLLASVAKADTAPGRAPSSIAERDSHVASSPEASPLASPRKAPARIAPRKAPARVASSPAANPLASPRKAPARVASSPEASPLASPRKAEASPLASPRKAPARDAHSGESGDSASSARGTRRADYPARGAAPSPAVSVAGDAEAEDESGYEEEPEPAAVPEAEASPELSPLRRSPLRALAEEPAPPAALAPPKRSSFPSFDKVLRLKNAKEEAALSNEGRAAAAAKQPLAPKKQAAHRTVATAPKAPPKLAARKPAARVPVQPAARARAAGAATSRNEAMGQHEAMVQIEQQLGRLAELSVSQRRQNVEAVGARGKQKLEEAATGAKRSLAAEYDASPRRAGELLEKCRGLAASWESLKEAHGAVRSARLHSAQVRGLPRGNAPRCNLCMYLSICVYMYLSIYVSLSLSIYININIYI